MWEIKYYTGVSTERESLRPDFLTHIGNAKTLKEARKIAKEDQQRLGGNLGKYWVIQHKPLFPKAKEK